MQPARKRAEGDKQSFCPLPAIDFKEKDIECALYGFLDLCALQLQLFENQVYFLPVHGHGIQYSMGASKTDIMDILET
jgi:hypothetical protein